MTTQHPSLRPTFLAAFSSPAEDNRATVRPGGRSVPGWPRIPTEKRQWPGADDFRGALSGQPAVAPRRWPGGRSSELGARSSELEARVERPTPAATRQPTEARQAAAGGWPGGRSSELGARSSQLESSARHPPPPANLPKPGNRRPGAGRAVGARSSELGARSSSRAPDTRRRPPTRRSPASGGRGLAGRSELGARSSELESRARHPPPPGTPPQAKPSDSGTTNPRTGHSSIPSATAPARSFA